MHKYEERTGLTVSREELESGALKTKLAPSDYDTACLVSFLLSHLLYHLQSARGQFKNRFGALSKFFRLFVFLRVSFCGEQGDSVHPCHVTSNYRPVDIFLLVATSMGLPDVATSSTHLDVA